MTNDDQSQQPTQQPTQQPAQQPTQQPSSQTPAESPTGAAKPPQQWATGDEPATGPQLSYLSTLAREAGEQVPEQLTKAEASQLIDRLQGASPRVEGAEQGTGQQGSGQQQSGQQEPGQRSGEASGPGSPQA